MLWIHCRLPGPVRSARSRHLGPPLVATLKTRHYPEAFDSELPSGDRLANKAEHMSVSFFGDGKPESQKNDYEFHSTKRAQLKNAHN